MRIETINQLKKSFLFNGLPDETLQVLAEKISSKTLKKNEKLFEKGDVGDTLFMIDEGFLDIVTEDKQGGALVLNQCGPGETIGEMSLFDKGLRSASVVANTDAHVLALKQDAFFELLEENPETAQTLIRSISSRLRFATTYIEKAIEWSGRIAEGDYSSAMNEIQTSQSLTVGEADNEAKANQMLAAFFKMVEELQAREDELKQQIIKLNFEIDQAQRKKEFEELTSSESYTDLKSQAQKFRQQRAERAKRYANKDLEEK